jgi:hypothetical protein
MDLKKKLAAAKKKLKKDARVISACAITATIAVGYYEYKNREKLVFTKEDQALVKTGDVNMRYSVNGSDYSLRYIGNTPKN